MLSLNATIYSIGSPIFNQQTEPTAVLTCICRFYINVIFHGLCCLVCQLVFFE